MLKEQLTNIYLLYLNSWNDVRSLALIHIFSALKFTTPYAPCTRGVL